MPAETKRLSIVYFGTPGYAVPALQALREQSGVHISLVVTQPDRPAGRGHAVHESAVKQFAKLHGIPVFQPETLRTVESRELLESQNADLFVVAAYGLIFGRKTLVIPRLGCLNLHASLLPKYRGASPVAAAILAGDQVTGVTLMQMDAGMDTGDILAMSVIEVAPTDTTASLTERLAQVGASLLVNSLHPYANEELKPKMQPLMGRSTVRPLVKADGWIDWSKPATAIERQVRAMWPWPRAWTTLPNGATLQVFSARLQNIALQALPGEVVVLGKSIVVNCGQGALELERVQLTGGSEVDASSLLHGRKLSVGDRLGILGRPIFPPPFVQELDSV